MRAEAPAVLHPAVRPVVLVGSVRPRFAPELFVEAALGFLDALGSRLRHRPRFAFALLVELALGFSQPRPAALTGPQLLGQLVAAGVAVELVLCRVDGLGVFEDLAREL